MTLDVDDGAVASGRTRLGGAGYGGAGVYGAGSQKDPLEHAVAACLQAAEQPIKQSKLRRVGHQMLALLKWLGLGAVEDPPLPRRSLLKEAGIATSLGVVVAVSVLHDAIDALLLDGVVATRTGRLLRLVPDARV